MRTTQTLWMGLSIMVLLPAAQAQRAEAPSLSLSTAGVVGLSSLPLYNRLSADGRLDIGLRAGLLGVRRPAELTRLVPASGFVPQLEPSAFVSYHLLPQRLGLHSTVRLGSGRDARGMALEVKLSSQFALTDTTQLGLSASSSWLNGSASQQLMGELTGSQAVYTMESPSYGLRDLRAGISLSGPLLDRWSYSAGAHLGRLYGDPRMTSLLSNGGTSSSRTGLVFFNARFAF